MLRFDEQGNCKLSTTEIGNQKFCTQNAEILNKAINKEDIYTHTLPLH